MDLVITTPASHLIDIYACYDLLEAQRIQALLEAQQIPCRLVDQASSPLPLTIGRFGEKRLAVPHADVIAAKQRLAEAIRDGYLSGAGRFCGARADFRPSGAS